MYRERGKWQKDRQIERNMYTHRERDRDRDMETEKQRLSWSKGRSTTQCSLLGFLRSVLTMQLRFLL